MSFNLAITDGTPDFVDFGNVGAGKKCFRPLTVTVTGIGAFDPNVRIAVTSTITNPVGASAAVPLVPGWAQTASGFEITVSIPPDPPFAVDVPIPLILSLTLGVPPSVAINGTLEISLPDDPSVPPLEIDASGTVTTPASDAVALDFVLDCSTSMKSVVSGSSDTRITRMRAGVQRALGLLTENDWVGLWRMRNVAARLFTGIQPYVDGHKGDIDSALTGVITAGSGLDVPGVLPVAVAASQLALTGLGPCAPGRRAMIVISDGLMTAPLRPSVSSFAVGPGQDFEVNTSVLAQCSMTNSVFVFETPELDGSVDSFRLDKYLIQIIADLAGFSIVLDPNGVIKDGETVTVPFELGEEDEVAKMIVLVDDAKLVDVELHAPEADDAYDDRREAQRGERRSSHEPKKGERPPRPRCKERPVDFLGLRGASRTRFDGYVNLAIDRSRDADPELRSNGRWQMRFGLSDSARESGIKNSGVRYSVLVLARTAIQLFTEVTQDHYGVGATAFLTARVTEHSGPIDRQRAIVFAEILFPDGGRGVLRLEQSFAGRYTAELKLTQVGVYRIRIRVQGKSLSGGRFHRERTHNAYTAICSTPCGPRPQTHASAQGLEVDVTDELEEGDALDEGPESRLM